MKSEPLAELGGLKFLLAFEPFDQRQFHLLQNHLILTLFPEGILAEPGGNADVTPRTRVTRFGHTDGVDVGVKFVWLAHEEESDVVVEGSLAVIGMNDHLLHESVLVGIGLVVVGRIPFSKSNLQPILGREFSMKEKLINFLISSTKAKRFDGNEH